MYRVELKEGAIDAIDNFIDSYLHSFLDLFIDSGIEDVYLIEENYKNIATKFRNQIYSSIEHNCEQNIIYGKRIGNKNELSVILSVGNYKLFIDYKEDNIGKIRYIENIEFYKK